MIRLILIILYLIIFFTIGQLSLIVGFVLELLNKELANNYYKSIINSVFRIIMFISGTHVDIKGIDNIKNENYFIVANHRSFFDTITLFPYIKLNFGLIAKKELNLPIFGLWMKKINCLFIDRKDLRQGLLVINKSVENIKNNISMMVFPEGTRNKNIKFEDMLEFKEGSFKIAKMANCKILPIAIKNADDCFEKNNYIIKKATVHIVIGEPFDINYLKQEDQNSLGSYTRNIIINL